MSVWSEKTPEQRERIRETNRAASARYRETEGYARAQAKALPRKIVTITAYNQRLRVEHPEIIAARARVAREVRSGRMKPPAACGCGFVGRIEAHHYLGYSVEHQLDVLWFCSRCHKAAHGKGVI